MQETQSKVAEMTAEEVMDHLAENCPEMSFELKQAIVAVRCKGKTWRAASTDAGVNETTLMRGMKRANLPPTQAQLAKEQKAPPKATSGKDCGKDLLQHPLSKVFPPMSPDEKAALRDSLEVIGVQNPITLHDGMVLDGWNRYTTCLELGMDCPYAELPEWIEPAQFVRAQNKDRRHLPLSAWALIEVGLSAWHPGSTTKQGGDLKSPLAEGRTNQAMADAVGATTRTIQRAKAVHQDAVKEVQDAVKSGKMGLPKAAAISKLPKEKQVAAMAQPVQKQEEPQEPEYSELDAAKDQVASLQDELVIARMGDVPEEERNQAAQRIAELQAEVKTLQAALKAVTISRDSLMEDVAQLKRQIKLNEKRNQQRA